MRTPRALVTLLAALALAGCVTAGLPASDVGISSSGVGRVAVRPDSAEVDVGVEARAPQLADATAEVSRRMREVLARVKALGVADADIRTTAYRIEPIAEPRPSGDTSARIIGYRVLNVVDVRARDVDRVGAIVDAAVGAGANVVGNVQFRLADPSKVEAEARRLAMQDARGRAQQVADAAGVRLGRLIAVSEAPGHDRFSGGRVMLTAASAGPIEAGQLEVVVNVSTRYAIEP